MSDNSYQGGDQRRRRRRGGKSQSSGRPSAPRPQSTPRSGVQPQTGMQKFLSLISFGLLGKPTPKLTRPPVTFAGTTTTKQRNNDGQSPRESRSSSGPRFESGNGSGNRSGEGSSRPPREPKPRREPLQVSPADISTERLYVGNLNYDATESDLFELFNGVGSVKNAEVVVNNRTQRSKGFAFITMASVEEARRAVEELNGKEFMGRPIQLSGAKPISANDSRHEGGGRDRDHDEEEHETADTN